MKSLVPTLLLLLACFSLCHCSHQAQGNEGWSPNSAQRGKSLFEGARMGWHATDPEDEY